MFPVVVTVPRTYTKEFGQKVAAMVQLMKADRLRISHDENLDPIQIWSSWDCGEM